MKRARITLENNHIVEIGKHKDGSFQIRLVYAGLANSYLPIRFNADEARKVIAWLSR